MHPNLPSSLSPMCSPSMGSPAMSPPTVAPSSCHTSSDPSELPWICSYTSLPASTRRAMDKQSTSIRPSSSISECTATISRTIGLICYPWQSSHTTTPHRKRPACPHFFANKGYHPALEVYPERDLALTRAHNYAVDLQALHEELKLSMTKAQRRYQRGADRCRNPPPDFKIGDKVFV